MRAAGALLAYLVVGAVFGYLGLLLGTSLVQGTENRGPMVAGLIIGGGIGAFLMGLLVPAPEDRTFRLVFLALCMLCAGMVLGGFVSMHAV